MPISGIGFRHSVGTCRVLSLPKVTENLIFLRVIIFYSHQDEKPQKKSIGGL